MNWIFEGRRSALATSVILSGRRSTLDATQKLPLSRLHRHFAWQGQHFRRVCVCSLRIPLSRLRQVVTTCKLRGTHGTSWKFTFHFTFHTPHSTLYTPHSTLYTPPFTLHTPDSTPYTLHSTLYTLHSTRYTPHSTLCILHCALHTLHFTLDTPHSTLDTLHSALFTLHSTLYTWHSTLYTLHSTLHTPQSPLHTLHTTLPPKTTVFTVHTLYSTPFHTPESTLVRQQGKNVQDCWNNLFHKSDLGCFRWLHLYMFRIVLTSVPWTYH